MPPNRHRRWTLDGPMPDGPRTDRRLTAQRRVALPSAQPTTAPRRGRASTPRHQGDHSGRQEAPAHTLTRSRPSGGAMVVVAWIVSQTRPHRGIIDQHAIGHFPFPHPKPRRTSQLPLHRRLQQHALARTRHAQRDTSKYHRSTMSASKTSNTLQISTFW
jgi:hypothetical protein